MARTKKTDKAAPAAVQEGSASQDVSQGVREPETLPGAAEAPVAGPVTQEVIGPEDPTELAGCQDTPQLEEEPILVVYAVTGCTRLNLRERPSLDASIVAELPHGDGVVGEDGPARDGWRWVATGRLEGWVMDKYLELLGVGQQIEADKNSTKE